MGVAPHGAAPVRVSWRNCGHHRGPRRPDRQAARPPRRGDARRPHRRARAPVRDRLGAAGRTPARIHLPAADPDGGQLPVAPVRAARPVRGDRRPGGAEAARGILLHADLPVDATPEDPDEFYDHQLVGLTAHDLDGSVLGEVVALVHGGAQDLLTIRTTDGRDALVPFVKALVPEVDVAGGRIVVADRPGPGRPAARGRLRSRPVRIDVLTIFPDYLAPLEPAGRQGPRQGPDRHPVHDLRQWAHDRHRTVDEHFYGGGAGMVMKPEPWGEASTSSPSTARPSWSRPPRAARSAKSWRATSRPASGSSSRAVATRASTSVSDGAASRAEVLEVSLGDYVLNGGGRRARDHRGCRASGARLHGQRRVARRGVPRAVRRGGGGCSSTPSTPSPRPGAATTRC